MNKIKISVVGIGDWGKNLARNFADLKVLHSICDHNLEKAQKIADNYKTQVHSWQEILANKDISAIAIATQAQTHYQLAREALQAGKHVFIEKPMAMSSEEVKDLCSLADKFQKKLMCGHLLQYHDAFISLKNMVLNGELGNVKYIYSNRLNLGKIYADQSVLWDLAPHDLSMTLSIVGNSNVTINHTSTQFIKHSIGDFSMLQLKFANGIKAHIFVSWLNPEKEQKFVVIGEKKMAIFNDLKPWENKIAICHYDISESPNKTLTSNKNLEYLPITPSEPLKNECQHFIDCIINNKKPLTDGMESLNIMRILEKASATNCPA